MTNIETVYENAIEHWRLNKGVGTAIIPQPYDYFPMVLGILQRIYSRSPTAQILVVVPTFQDRMDFIKSITTTDIEENNNEFKNLINIKKLSIYTYDFLKSVRAKTSNLMVVLVKPDHYDVTAFSELSFAKFKLVILDRIFANNNEYATLQTVCPVLPDFKTNELIAIRTNTPVEETLVGVSIDNIEVKTKLEQYTSYITTSLNIFGSLDIMQKAHIGDNVLNISAKQMCYNIAYENGWSETLDMSFPFNVQLDSMYNPNTLQERVSVTYELIRNRARLLTDYEGKLDAILDIVRQHIDKKILIINARAEFASIVCEFLNHSLDRICCVPYHDKLDPIPALDDTGEPILIKSGSHKGEPKIIAQKAQKSLNEKRFNLNKVNIISTNAAPDKDLTIDVQVVIITSPKCNTIEDYIYRLNNICFPDNKILLYTIYCEESLEQSLILNKTETNTHKIVNKSENYNVFEEKGCVVIDI